MRLNETAGLGGEAGRLAVDSADRRHGDVQRPRLAPQLRALARTAYADDTIVTEISSISTTGLHTSAARVTRPLHSSPAHLNIDVRQALRRLTQPALLVWGEEGSIAPIEEFRGFREMKPDFETCCSDSRG